MLRCQPNLKSLKPIASVALEEKLIHWIDDCELYGICVTYNVIKERAIEIATEMSVNIDLVFSNGSLKKLLNRHALRRHGVFGESNAVDDNNVQDARTKLKQITSLYKVNDMYNLDETAYLYCSQPIHTISKHSIKGNKDVKKRITMAVALNSDGADERDLKFIGTSAKPRYFRGG
ncbi:hypothetical protein THRCLA_22951 [Thraustotheca clavata]|uniref:HTH CENPB-type domain-containing protein n=1 Tax=Thraustotheca clavata TaxID=74557 RepID=A0A1V9YMB7_9STRA|nr:hypothetical protein THRCLA_22951 [Thraustotheca clavata]